MCCWQHFTKFIKSQISSKIQNSAFFLREPGGFLHMCQRSSLHLLLFPVFVKLYMYIRVVTSVCFILEYVCCKRWSQLKVCVQTAAGRYDALQRREQTWRTSDMKTDALQQTRKETSWSKTAFTRRHWWFQIYHRRFMKFYFFQMQQLLKSHD